MSYQNSNVANPNSIIVVDAEPVFVEGSIMEFNHPAFIPQGSFTGSQQSENGDSYEDSSRTREIIERIQRITQDENHSSDRMDSWCIIILSILLFLTSTVLIVILVGPMATNGIDECNCKT